jgi:hypothetical protein
LNRLRHGTRLGQTGFHADAGSCSTPTQWALGITNAGANLNQPPSSRHDHADQWLGFERRRRLNPAPGDLHLCWWMAAGLRRDPRRTVDLNLIPSGP